MGRPSAVTFEQVAALADGLRAKGEEPSARALRTVLGIGSQGTIQKHLEVWRQQRKADQVERVIPPAFARAVFALIDEETTRIGNELNNELNSARRAMNELATLNEQQYAELERCKDDQDELVKTNAQLEGKVGQLEGQLAAERDTANALRDELVKANFRLENLERLQQELSQTQAQLASERSLRQTAEVAAAVSAALRKTSARPSNPRPSDRTSQAVGSEDGAPSAAASIGTGPGDESPHSATDDRSKTERPREAKKAAAGDDDQDDDGPRQKQLC